MKIVFKELFQWEWEGVKLFYISYITYQGRLPKWKSDAVDSLK